MFKIITKQTAGWVWFFLSFMMPALSAYGSVKSGEPLLLGLEEALKFAAERNTEVQTGRLEVRSARQQIREITATGLPQVNASLGFQYFFDVPTSLVPAEFFGGQQGEFAEIQFGTEQNLTASANLSQNIFSGEYIVGLRAARIYRELADHRLMRTELEVKNMVTETYLLALMTGSNLQIVKENLANMRQTLHETERILEAGFTDPINVDQLKLSVANMQHAISTLERQERMTLNLLKFQMGLDMNHEVILTDELAELFKSLSMEAGAAAQFDPFHHIDFRLMLTQAEFTKMVLRREQSQSLPSLNATFVRQEMAMRNEFNFFKSGTPWFPTTFFGLNMNIPIFSSGMRMARINQAKIELEKASLAVDQVRQSLMMQMQKSRDDYQTAIEQYQNQRENLELAKRIYGRTTIMHREGLAGSLELTQASDQMLATQSTYLAAMFDVLNARNNLEKALGR